MPYSTNIVLHCSRGCEARVVPLVEEFMRDGVRWVCVVGPDCAKIEAIIEEVISGDETRGPYEMLTSSHKTVAEAMEYASSLKGKVHVVEV